MLIIGSVALSNWVNIGRGPKDLDMIISQNEYEAFCSIHTPTRTKGIKAHFENILSADHVEVEIAKAGSNQEMLLNLLDVKDFDTQFAGAETLYALKMSHRHLRNSPHFLKTMRDIHGLRKWLHIEGVHPMYADESIYPPLKEWYAERLKATYTYSHPKLDQKKDEFFDTSVFEVEDVYKYDHDSIHEAVKLFEKPAYSYFLEGDVKVGQSLFKSLPYELQLASVVEESSVLALERSIIPHDAHPDWAFSKALEKVCTSIASGWWRSFAWENYQPAIELYKNREQGLQSLLEQGIVNGVVKPFSGGY